MCRPIPSPRSYFLFLLVAAVFTGCKKSGNHPGNGLNGEIAPKDVACTIQGQVIDESGNPVQDASITAGSGAALSDANGIFRIARTSIDQNGGLIKVTWPGPANFVGNFTGMRNLFYQANTTNFVQIQKVSGQYEYHLQASNAGSVSIGPAALALDPNTFVKAADGTVSTGDVWVYGNYLDPSIEGYLPQMPGNMYTITENNTVAGLEPYGLVYMYVMDNAGEILALAKGAQATLHFPASGNVPGLSLYSFDSTSGFWNKEEGNVTHTGNVLSALITHFGTYSICATLPLVNYKATIVDPDGHPLADRPVEIVAPDGYFTTGYALTDSAGHLAGKIPSGQPLTLQIRSDCGGILYSRPIGPLTSDADLGTIQIPANNTNWVTLTGTLVDCNDLPLSNGYALVHLQDHIYKANVNSAGLFTMELENCSNIPECSLTAYNGTGDLASDPISVVLASASINLGNITVCSTPIDPNASYFYYSINGQAFDYITPSENASGSWTSANGSVGNYFIEAGNGYSFDPNFAYLFFAGAGAPGAYPFGSFQHHGGVSNLQFVPYRNTQVFLSEFGDVDQFISGSFADSLLCVTDSTHLFVKGVFRVKRIQ